MLDLFKKIVGTKNDRELKKLWPVVAQVNALEPEIEKLSADELRAKTAEFRERLAGGATLDEILPEAFAAVREASRRTTAMRHFDVQLLGGMVLHSGRISEMKTGEGKTLVATTALYLNALEGKGAHLITVNDYLARRDVQWMGPIYHALGLVGRVDHPRRELPLRSRHSSTKDYRFVSLRPIDRKDAYGADITYGTNNEFGFDYLRDNMKFSLEEYVQRELNYAIVDEVDNILIDEARTPLIISGAGRGLDGQVLLGEPHHPAPRQGVGLQRSTRRATTIAEKSLRPDRGWRRQGRAHARHLEPLRPDRDRHASSRRPGLRAHVLFKRDVDYVVKDGGVIIVDEFTGRLMPGRRWSDGLHQAVEAKEGVRIERENQTLATITIQNYFRMYKKLAGMTGTADTEAVEFKKIYKLDVIVIPPNRDDGPEGSPGRRLPNRAREVRRGDRGDRRLRTSAASRCSSARSPSRSASRLSKLLKKQGVRHNVLNAVNHEPRPRSSPRRAATKRSRSPPTWPAAAPTSCSAAIRSSSPAPRWRTSGSSGSPSCESRSRPGEALRGRAARHPRAVRGGGRADPARTTSRS